MTSKEKISLLEELLDVEEGTLEEDTVLADLDEWDSIAALSLSALCVEKYGKKVTKEQFDGFETVQDVLDFMEK